MKKLRTGPTAALLIAALALSACGYPNAITPIPITPNEVSSRNATSIIHTGSFWEYTLPVINSATLQPRQIVNGPNNTVWFPACYGAPTLYRLSAITGSVTPFKPPAIPSSVTIWGGETLPLIRESSTCAITAAGGYFWYTLVGSYEKLCSVGCFPAETKEWLVRAVPSTGVLKLFFVGNSGGTANIAVDAYGKLWFTLGSVLTSMSTSGVQGASLLLPNNFLPIWVTSARDKNLYVTASSYNSTTNQVLSAVFKVSPVTGTVITRFNLPSVTGNPPAWCDMPGTSVPSVAVCAITSDTNGNLWVAEPALNRIAKITTAGAITQYPVRTSNAWVTAITNSDGEPLTAAFSGAVWFTEAVGNKVGRITSSGSVTEYSIPTASALPSGIAPCPTTVCGANGGVWFAENATGKIGRYDF